MVPKRKQIQQGVTRSSCGSISAARSLDDDADLAGGDTKTMAFTNVEVNAPITRRSRRPPSASIRPILRWAHADRIAVLAAAAVLAIASAASLYRLQFDANVLHLLPRGGVAVPAFRDYLERFGSVDYLYVIVDAPEGTELGDYDETVEALTAALRQAPEIAHVDAGPRDRGRDWSYLSDRVLLLVTPSQPELLERFQPSRLAAQVALTRGSQPAVARDGGAGVRRPAGSPRCATVAGAGRG